MRKYYSTLLVTIQFSAIAIIVAPMWIPLHRAAFTFWILSLAFGAWAIISMKIQNLKIFPEPKPDAEFIGAGPYKFIRHPMYTSVLLTTLSYVLDRPGILAVSLWLILCTDLLLKLHYEEGLLRKKFPQYESYSVRTKKLVPFIY